MQLLKTRLNVAHFMSTSCTFVELSQSLSSKGIRASLGRFFITVKSVLREVRSSFLIFKFKLNMHTFFEKFIKLEDKFASSSWIEFTYWVRVFFCQTLHFFLVRARIFVKGKLSQLKIKTKTCNGSMLVLTQEPCDREQTVSIEEICGKYEKSVYISDSYKFIYLTVKVKLQLPKYLFLFASMKGL